MCIFIPSPVSKGLTLIDTRMLGEEKNIDGVAPLVTDPPHGNSDTLKINPFVKPPLYSAKTLNKSCI